MRIRFISVLLVLLLLCSCSQNGATEIEQLKVSDEEYTNKLTLMEQEINSLKETNNKLDTENINLRMDNSDLEDENIKLERSLERYRDLRNDSLFEWIYNYDWNSIKIKYNNGKSEIKIPSSKLAPYTFIGSIRKGWGPQAMDEGVCIYEFIRNDISYKIEIFKEHVFKYQDEFYYSDYNLFDLYESFIPPTFDWQKSDNSFNLIYNSKIINIGDSYYITDRTKNIAAYIALFQVVASPSKNKVGKLQDTIKCYNHGEVIKITIYDNYLSISYKNATTWYKGIDENIQPSGVISIFTAG